MALMLVLKRASRKKEALKAACLDQKWHNNEPNKLKLRSNHNFLVVIEVQCSGPVR